MPPKAAQQTNTTATPADADSRQARKTGDSATIDKDGSGWLDGIWIF
jgi:hypothetical protein